VRSARYESIRENSGSEVDLVDSRHVILEVHNVVENQSLSLADRVVTDDPLLCWHLAQVNILDMVPHVRRAFKGARSLLIWKPLVSDANDTLGLLADEGKLTRRWEGLGSGRFPFDQIFRGWNRPWLASASLKLLSGGERDEKIDGRNLARDDVLGT